MSRWLKDSSQFMADLSCSKSNRVIEGMLVIASAGIQIKIDGMERWHFNQELKV